MFFLGEMEDQSTHSPTCRPHSRCSAVFAARFPAARKASPLKAPYSRGASGSLSWFASSSLSIPSSVYDSSLPYRQAMSRRFSPV